MANSPFSASSLFVKRSRANSKLASCRWWFLLFLRDDWCLFGESFLFLSLFPSLSLSCSFSLSLCFYREKKTLRFSEGATFFLMYLSYDWSSASLSATLRNPDFGFDINHWNTSKTFWLTVTSVRSFGSLSQQVMSCFGAYQRHLCEEKKLTHPQRHLRVATRAVALAPLDNVFSQSVIRCRGNRLDAAAPTMHLWLSAAPPLFNGFFPPSSEAISLLCLCHVVAPAVLLMTAARCQKAADKQTALLAVPLEGGDGGDGGMISVSVVMSLCTVQSFTCYWNYVMTLKRLSLGINSRGFRTPGGAVLVCVGNCCWLWLLRRDSWCCQVVNKFGQLTLSDGVMLSGKKNLEVEIH